MSQIELNAKLDAIERLIKWLKGLVWLMAVLFILGMNVNYQIMTHEYRHKETEQRVAKIEQHEKDYWRSPMILALTVDTHSRTNSLLSTDEAKKIVDSIKEQFQQN